MASDAGPPDKWLLLRDAIDDAGFSVRGLSREWAGKGASEKEIEAARGEINRWLSQGTRPTRRNALKLAKLLKKPAEYFVTQRSPRRLTLKILARQVEELTADVELIREELRRGLEPKRK